jgi:hypothetical protein
MILCEQVLGYCPPQHTPLQTCTGPGRAGGKLLALIVRGRDARQHDAVIRKLAIFVRLGHAALLSRTGGSATGLSVANAQGSPVGDAQVCASLPTIANFQLIGGADQKVVNFEQISIRKWAHALLERVFLEVGRQFDLNIHGDRS